MTSMRATKRDHCAAMMHETISRDPIVSVVVCTYNEEKYIGRVLEQMIAQRGIDGDIEIIVVDGGSDDRTVEIIHQYQPSGRVTLLHNARRDQVVGLNLGRRHARGRYIAFLNAHVEYSDDYLASCLEVLRRTGAGNVGGVQRAVGEGSLGEAIAWAMSSPFGVGDAHHHYTNREEPVESVMGGFMERSTIDAIGGHDEESVINEDSEINQRLRKAGFSVVVSPKIRFRYYSRATLRGLALQYFRYGYWRRRTAVQHPHSLPLRVYAPPLLVAALIASLTAGILSQNPRWLVAPGAYAGFLAVSGAIGLKQLRSPAAASRIPAAIATMHLAFGAGWWCGVAKHRRSRA